jgi:hypothetical protein
MHLRVQQIQNSSILVSGLITNPSVSEGLKRNLRKTQKGKKKWQKFGILETGKNEIRQMNKSWIQPPITLVTGIVRLSLGRNFSIRSIRRKRKLCSARHDIL